MSGYGAFNLGCPRPHRKARLTRPTKLNLMALGYGIRVFGPMNEKDPSLNPMLPSLVCRSRWGEVAPLGATSPRFMWAEEVKTMTQVNLELPETIYSVLHCSPGEPDKELRLAASAQWSQQGRISQSLFTIFGLTSPEKPRSQIASWY